MIGPRSPLEVAWSALVNMTSAAAVSRAAEPGPTLHRDLATHTHTFNRLQLFRLVSVSTYTYMWISSQSYLVQFRFAGRWHKRKRLAPRKSVTCIEAAPGGGACVLNSSAAAF